MHEAQLKAAAVLSVVPTNDKIKRKKTNHFFNLFSARPRVVCRACGPAAPVRRVALPHVFRYLAAELAAMNIKTTLDLSV